MTTHRDATGYALLALLGLLCQTPALGNDAVMGNWDGDWKNDDGHGGKLTAQVIAEGGDNYKAIFTAYYGPISVFKVSLKGKREKEEVKFGGKVDLGAAFGGEFDWTGGVSGETFTGRYTSAKDVGQFTLKKIRKTSGTLGSKPPAGATVLFDGTNLDAWQMPDGGPVDWRIVDGALEVGHGDIYSRAEFGDMQLHVEFMTPFMPDQRGAARGNSGVFLCRPLESQDVGWEVQILDSFGLDPKDDGCGALLGRTAPSSNACLPPGEWQTFDITFTAPRLDEAGKTTEKARVTVVHNGTKVINNVELSGSGPRAGHIMLQDHGDPVRYRNVWVNPIR